MAVERPQRWRPGTVRARTTLAATCILGLALVVGGIALVTLLNRSLVRNIDEVTEARAEDVAAVARQGALPETLAVEEDAVVQVVDGQGRVVAASANVHGSPPMATARPVGAEATIRTVDNLPGFQGEFRLLALRATSPDGPLTIYVATSLEPADETLLLVRTSLLVGAPLLLALASALTWVTVGRALQPVEAIRSQVADLSSRDLHRRVPVPGTKDEISRLAHTMNAMLDRLQTSAEKQQRFVADASHELQTPLAATRTDLEVALAHPDAAAWQGTARDLLDENRHMERLVADLLFIARADDATPPGPTSPVDLHDVVLEEATRISGLNRVRIDTAAVTGAVVVGRRDDLARAVRNVLDNAERHASSTVTISLREEGGTAALAICDDGPGVPPEYRDRIFERFARLDDARSRRGGGTGLGLAIVREIVERHHGTVSVRDSSAGACFVIELPAD